MRLLITLAAASSLAALPAAAAPAKSSAPAKPAAASQSSAPEQNAVLYLKVLISGLQSDQVEQPVKGALVGCIYGASLGKITEAMDKLIADNPGKVSRDNPTQLLSAMLAVCGYKPEGGAAKTTPTPAPAPQPKGR